MQRWHGDVILLDLFGTVVHFMPQVPTLEVAGTRWRSTMTWLREAAARELPTIPFDAVLAALMSVTEEIVRQRPPEYHEVHSHVRFERALQRLGVAEATRPEVAQRLCLAHMQHLASRTFLPAGHREVLENLTSRYRLGLVSNFDHAATAHRILAEHEVTSFFEVVLISDEFGRRKPHPSIFEAALEQMGVPAPRALFVGDSADDDVVGASNVGLAITWINPKGETLPMPAPDYTISDFVELPNLVE